MRSRLFVMSTFVGLAFASACVADRSDTAVVALGPCVGDVAKEIPLSECPLMCPAKAYALCDGTKYSSCDCTLPGAYMLAGGDGGSTDAEQDGSLSPLDSEDLGIGECSGKVVLAIPSADCPSLCPGAIAYAVCEAGRYSECSCTIPKGYKLAVAESGPPEASVDASDASDAPLDQGAHEGG